MAAVDEAAKTEDVYDVYVVPLAPLAVFFFDIAILSIDRNVCRNVPFGLLQTRYHTPLIHESQSGLEINRVKLSQIAPPEDGK